MYTQVSNIDACPNITFNAQVTPLPFQFGSVGSAWDCFSNFECTMQSLTGINFQLDQQTEMLLKISSELMSIETDLAAIQSRPSDPKPKKNRKIMKPRKTSSRTIMHKILSHDVGDDSLDAEVFVPGLSCHKFSPMIRPSLQETCTGVSRPMV